MLRTALEASDHGGAPPSKCRGQPTFVSTLDAYLASGCNASRTARAVKLHLKSLQYRLRRISEICGLDLTDRDARLDMELALRILGPAQTLRSAADDVPFG